MPPHREATPVAVVVVTYDSAACIDACLASAVRQQPAEIVVVDNGSRDGTRERVAEWHTAGVQLFAQPDNTGFAAGCNLGAAHTTAPFVLFLNDDAVLEPGYAAELIAALAADGDAASATGKLLKPKKRATDPDVIDSAGVELAWHALRPFDRGHESIDRGQFDAPCEVFGPSGAAALYRRAAWTTAQETPFDPELFAYYEDVDLAWRTRRRGWHHLYVPTAIGRHGRRGPAHKPLAVRARAFVNRYTVWRRNETMGHFLSYAAVAVPWEAARLTRVTCAEPRFAAAIARCLAERMFSAPRPLAPPD